MSYLLTLPLFAGVSRVRALSPAWTGSHARKTLISRTHLFLPHDIPPTKKSSTIKSCKGVKQINNRISFKHPYHSYLSAFFISAGVPNGEFPEILIAKCRSRFYCTWFFCWGDIVRRLEIRSVIAAIKNSYKPLCKQESDNFWCRGKLLILIKRAMNSSINNRISLNMTFTFTIRISLCFSSAREFQMGNFQKYWSQNVGQDFIVLIVNWG
jgi:hypothetical protein